MAKEKKDAVKNQKATIADLFIQREKLTAGLNQTNIQLQEELNKLQKLKE